MTSYDAKSTLYVLNDFVELVCAGFAGVAVQLTGTWVGTVSFEATVDGATWVPLLLSNVATGDQASSATANAIFSGQCAGARKVRAKMTAYTSGIAVVSLKNSGDVGGSGGSGGGGGGAVTIADGADVAEGAIADAGVTGDNAGTVSAKLRGISTILADVWDSLNHRLNVAISNATLAVTQSGAWAVAQSGAWSAKWLGPGGTRWTATHVPAANAQATATKAAAGGGIKNVCTGFTVTLASSSTTPPAAIQLTVAVIDGTTGTTTYLWRTVIALPAVAGAITAFVRHGIWLPGTDNTAMTLEFSAAGGTNTIESVTMEGTTE